MSRPINYTTTESLEQLAQDGGYTIEFGTDSRGDYGELMTREGTIYRARLAVAS